MGSCCQLRPVDYSPNAILFPTRNHTMDRAVAHARGCAEWLRVRRSTLGKVSGRGLFVALPPGMCAAGAADEKCTDYGLDMATAYAW